MANACVQDARSFCVPGLTERPLIEPPRPLKQRLRKRANFPRYGPVGMRDPQQQVQVWLHGLGEPMDVTRNNVVAALRPFTIGVMLERSCSDILNGQPMHLRMHELREPRRLLG